MFRAMKHVFIVNPAAGKSDRTESYRKLIDAAFVPRGLQYELLVSQAPGDCRKLAQQAAASGEEVRLYACGGDGTLNEVVNGVIGCPNAAVTHYPGGSGNDAIKIFDDPAAFTSIERLLSAEEAPFDLIRCNDSYALNVLSIGFDARVGTDIARFKRLPLVTGKGAYVLSILSNMVHGLSADYTVTLDSGEVADALSQDYGIATRPGAHCAPRMHEALGTKEQGAVRFSFGWYNTEEEVDAEIAKYAESAEKSAEDIKKTLSDSDMEYFKELVKTQKAIDLIVNNSVEEEEAKA